MAIIEEDTFGLESERKIKSSGVRNVFIPHMPVQDLNLFFGRQDEVRSLISYLQTPGQHALLFGNRGVGKSSLANIASELILKNLAGGQIIKKRCSSDDDFVSIVGEALAEVGIDIHETKLSKGSNHGFDKVANYSKSSTSEAKGPQALATSPSWVAKKLSDISAIFVIDELDSITNKTDKKKIAELIKQLSDEASKLKILIVGIAETANELTAGHPSVARCLKEVKLANMSDTELEDIIVEGAKRLGLSFKPSAIKKIVSLSSGYAHFTHLLALKAAELIIVEERTEVSLTALERALELCINDAEGSLRKAYQEAVRSSKEEYANILLAAALCRSEEIEAKEIRSKYQELFGTEISQGTLNNYFQRLVSDDRSAILRRLAKGIYKFNDPRMPSFVRIAQKYIN